MRKSSKEPKPQSVDIILRYLTHPITVSLMTVIDCAGDEELTSYGTIASAALMVMVSWAKKAAFGFASVEELKSWFFNEHVPKRVQDLLARIGGLIK